MSKKRKQPKAINIIDKSNIPLPTAKALGTNDYIPTQEPKKVVGPGKFVATGKTKPITYENVAFGTQQPNFTAPLIVPAGFSTQIPYNSAINSTIIQNNSAIPITTFWQATVTDSTWFSCTLYLVTSIISRIGQYQHKDKKKQEFVRATHKRCGEIRLKQAIIAPAIIMGFSVTTLNWTELLEESGRTDIKSVAGLPPDSILLAVTPEGDLDPDFGVMQYYYNLNSSWQQNTKAFSRYQNAPFASFGGTLTPQRQVSFNPMFLSAIPKDWYIIHSHNPIGLTGNHYGIPAGQAAFSALMNKVNTAIKMQIALTYKASPLLWIETDTQTTVQYGTQFISKAQDVANILPSASESGYAISEGLGATKLTTIDNTADLDKMLQCKLAYDDEIRAAFITPNLVGNSGSYANAMANGEANTTIIANLTLMFKETLETQFAKRLLDYAFGFDEEDNGDGYFELLDNSLEEKILWGKLLESVVQSGTQDMKSLEDVNFWRAKLGQEPLEKLTDDMMFAMMGSTMQGSNVGKAKEDIKQPYANGMKKNKENTYKNK